MEIGHIHISRKGFEFRGDTKKKAWKRSGGICEWPQPPCPDQATRVDHLTSITLSGLLNGSVPDKTVKSVNNIQVLCTWHDGFKKAQEDWYIRQMREKISQTQVPRSSEPESILNGFN